MGLQPNKYHISEDGNVYKVNEDGSFTFMGNIEDLSKLRANSESVSEKSQDSLSSSNTVPFITKVKKPQVLVSLFVLSIIVFAVLLANHYDNLELTENGMYRENLFINTDPFPSDTTNLLTIMANGVTIYMRHIDGAQFKGRVPELDVDCQRCTSEDWTLYDLRVDDYYIGLTEVTQEMWQAVMGESFKEYLDRIVQENSYLRDDGDLCRYGLGDKLPVYYIDKPDAEAFISKLNRLTRKRFRLPTATEWIYAQMGGNIGNHTEIYGLEEIDKVSWRWNYDNQRHDVATKMPNELGLYDMVGNVMEWTTSYPYDCYIDESNVCFLQDCWRVCGHAYCLGFRLAMD